MSNPGFMGQQAAQQAAAAASRAAQQQAALAQNLTLQGTQRAARSHSPYYRHASGRRLGVFGRLLRLVFSLVFFAVAIGIFLVILSAAQPDWFEHVKTWFDQTFGAASGHGG